MADGAAAGFARVLGVHDAASHVVDALGGLVDDAFLARAEAG